MEWARKGKKGTVEPMGEFQIDENNSTKVVKIGSQLGLGMNFSGFKGDRDVFA